MPFALQSLVFLLPFVAFPRLIGSVKASDFGFAFVIFCASVTNRLRIGWHVVACVVFFAVFGAYGFYRINYVEPITILGSWASGLFSTKAYQLIDLIQTTLYIVGASVYGMFLLHPRSGLLRFQYWFFIIWSACCILMFFALSRFSPSSIFAPDNYMIGTFTEKGPMSTYIVFCYCLFLTCLNVPGAPKFKPWQIALYVAAVVLDLVFCKADRGTLLFLVFNVFYFVSRRPSAVIRMLPLAALVLIALIPLYGRGADKVGIYLSVLTSDSKNKMQTPVGRYAAILLTPSLVQDAPVLGVGYGNYIFYRCSKKYGWFLVPLAKDEPDNALLQVTLECGLVGLAVFGALMIGYPAYHIARAKATRILWPFFAIYIVGLFSGVTCYFLMWVWFYSLMAVIKAYAMENRRLRAASLDYRPIALPGPISNKELQPA